LTSPQEQDSTYREKTGAIKARGGLNALKLMAFSCYTKERRKQQQQKKGKFFVGIEFFSRKAQVDRKMEKKEEEEEEKRQ
jgi:hypothetical protein